LWPLTAQAQSSTEYASEFERKSNEIIEEGGDVKTYPDNADSGKYGGRQTDLTKCLAEAPL